MTWHYPPPPHDPRHLIVASFTTLYDPLYCRFSLVYERIKLFWSVTSPLFRSAAAARSLISCKYDPRLMKLGPISWSVLISWYGCKVFKARNLIGSEFDLFAKQALKFYPHYVIDLYTFLQIDSIFFSIIITRLIVILVCYLSYFRRFEILSRVLSGLLHGVLASVTAPYSKSSRVRIPVGFRTNFPKNKAYRQPFY